MLCGDNATCLHAVTLIGVQFLLQYVNPAVLENPPAKVFRPARRPVRLVTLSELGSTLPFARHQHFGSF
jgi:hypothetical protein